MSGWQLPKRLKPYRWLLLTLLGIFSLTIAIILGQIALSQGEQQSAQTVAPAIPSSDGAPFTEDRDAPSIPASPSAPAKQSAVGKLEADSSNASPLSAEEQAAQQAEQAQQQAAQQAAIAELEASIPTVDSLIEMKVAIEISVPSVIVGTSAEAYLLDEAGQQIDTLTDGSRYTAQVSGDAIVFDGTSLSQILWIEPSPNGVFYLNDRPYRGRLLLAAAKGSLWAVNYVSMRSYLFSVVPSEVSPSWNMEALKAQAVAARSYALTYRSAPINSLYDMGDDEYFQVYSGIRTEANRTKQAVDETAGEYVSKSGRVVESLYAASEDIVREAFQGQGMSQLGALRLADQGYTYEQILANYYPGTKVGRLARDF